MPLLGCGLLALEFHQEGLGLRDPQAGSLGDPERWRLRLRLRPFALGHVDVVRRIHARAIVEDLGDPLQDLDGFQRGGGAPTSSAALLAPAGAHAAAVSA